MFEKFNFEKSQIEKYYESAIKDFHIATKHSETEIIFQFSYNALIKLAITICAAKGLRVKARQGHHIELINKLSKLLANEDVKILGNEMRTKRNWELYGGGGIISDKEAALYIKYIKNFFKQTEKIINPKKLI